jgi:protocatechuate 3,4-dioxygenase beta subunit
MPPNGMAIEVKSDPDGTYAITWQKNSFNGGQNSFIFVHDTEHHLAAAHDLDETTTNLDLRLQPALTLSVKAQDAQGKPIPSATATLFIRSGNLTSSIGQMPDSADDQGVIEFPDLPQERGYSATISAKDYGSVTVQAEAGQTKTTHFDFPAAVLKVADRKLAGQVLGFDNKPVSNASVGIQGDGQPGSQTTTDAAGHFSFDAVCEGAVHLYASSQGGVGPGNFMLHADGQAQGGDTNVVIRFTINGQGGGPNSRTVTTSGRVLSPAGVPAAGVLLSIEPGSGINVELKSDAEGKFSITWQEQNMMSLPAATATPARGAPAVMRHSLVGRDLEHHWAAAVAVDDQTTNVDLPLQEALTIAGSVKDPDGAPVKNATARAILFSGTASGLIGGPQPATVGAQGAFSIGVLPPGQQYSLSVSAPGYGSATRRVQADETQTNHLVLPPFTLKLANLKLEGQVVDADDQPVAGIRVTLQGEGQTSGSATTDAKGHFAYDSVCEGDVVLSVASRNVRSGRPSYRGRAQARGGDTDVVVKLENN